MRSRALTQIPDFLARLGQGFVAAAAVAALALAGGFDAGLSDAAEDLPLFLGLTVRQ